MSAIQKLHKLGQSLWYDNIQRRLIENGELAGMIRRGEIRGVTSNPTIFHNAIARSHDYDSSLTPMAWAGWSAEEIFYQLAIEDIRAAADLFAPLYQESAGGDGYVSLEVSPYLANDAQGTLSEAKLLWARVDRPNLMIKIPATRAGLPAIRDAIAAGMNINVTLIFSLERYKEVMEAYLSGLELRRAQQLPVDSIASVASFFVSRVDSKVDARLGEIIRAGGTGAEQAARLLGQAAIANARLAYAQFKETFSSPRFEKLRASGARVQRPLWASTSTKNPDYRDVMYVEELIGPNTVNTVPPQTLVAFGDHGVAKAALEDNLDGMRRALAGLEALSISMIDVTRQLEEEGVKSFADSFTALIRAVEENRTAAVAQLGPLQDRTAAQIRQLEKAEFPRRIWAHDAGLWAPTEAGKAEVRQRLGWLETPERSRALLPDLARLVKEVQAAGYTHALLLGMGGSSLAAEVMAEVIGPREVYGANGLELLVLDSTDPVQVRAAARWSSLDKTLYIVSSKGGKTSEVNAFLDFFWPRARRRLGEKAGEHFIAITDPGTALEKTARERKFRRVLLADPNVGGRYSALASFGLTPAALMGIDPKTLLDRAAWMAAQCAATVPAGRSQGLALGAVLGEAALQGRDKLTFLADPPVESFGAWLEQLIAESTGKEGRGIVPVELEPPQPAKKYAPDRLFVYLRMTGEQDARVEQLRGAGHPALVFPFQAPEDLGAEFFRWEFAVAAAGHILGMNCFDQPDVQDAKDRTIAKVAVFQRTRALNDGEPVWEGPGGRVYGWDFPGLNTARDLPDVVRAFVAQAREHETIAIDAFFPRNPRVLKKLQTLRARILKASGRATTLGFGPRYLHSSGQLQKGGPNGLILLITQRPPTDLEIPGQQMMFGTLLRAQALGDLEALLGRGKHAVRIHLVDATIEDLLF